MNCKSYAEREHLAETPRFEVSDLGLHCLQMSPSMGRKAQMVKNVNLFKEFILKYDFYIFSN